MLLALGISLFVAWASVLLHQSGPRQSRPMCISVGHRGGYGPTSDAWAGNKGVGMKRGEATDECCEVPPTGWHGLKPRAVGGEPCPRVHSVLAPVLKLPLPGSRDHLWPVHPRVAATHRSGHRIDDPPCPPPFHSDPAARYATVTDAKVADPRPRNEPSTLRRRCDQSRDRTTSVGGRG